MEEALNTAIYVINFVKSNSVNDRFFLQFCEYENFTTLFLHTEARWLSKGISLERLVNLWEPLNICLIFSTQMTQYNSKIVHLEGLRVDFERRSHDLITIDYPL